MALEVKAVEDALKKKDPDLFTNVDDEIISPAAVHAASIPSAALRDDPGRPARSQRQTDSKRIRYKALMRRARARSEIGGWQNLEGAYTDYTALQSMDTLTGGDRKLVTAQLSVLPTRIKEAKEKETAQMWDQLKQAGRCSFYTNPPPALWVIHMARRSVRSRSLARSPCPVFTGLYYVKPIYPTLKNSIKRASLFILSSLIRRQWLLT